MALLDATIIAGVMALLEITGTSQDTVLANYITIVSQRIEDFIDRPLHQTSRTEEYDLRPRQTKLFLRAYPLTAQNQISSIKIALDWDYASAAAVDSSDYHVDLDTGTINFNYIPITNYMDNNLMTAPNAVQVVYTGGFAATTDGIVANYPAISSACEQQVIAMWRRRDQPMQKATKIGEYGATIEGPLRFLPDVVEALMPYRRQRFGA